MAAGRRLQVCSEAPTSDNKNTFHLRNVVPCVLVQRVLFQRRLLSMNDAPARRHTQLLTIYTAQPDRLQVVLEPPPFEWSFVASYGGDVAVELGGGLGEEAGQEQGGMFKLPQLLVDLDASPPNQVSMAYVTVEPSNLMYNVESRDAPFLWRGVSAAAHSYSTSAPA